MPIFWLGLMLLVLFAAGLGWLPVGGLMPVGLDPPRITGMSVIDSLLSGNATMIGASLRHMLLPAVTLASVPLALIARITRAEVLSAATADHVRTARAKGVTDAGVILRHILRNAAIPIVTVIGLQLGLLLSGAVLTETIYSLPGLGRLMVDSILSRDYLGGAGGRAVHRRAVRAGEPRGRYPVCGARSAHQPGMSATARVAARCDPPCAAGHRRAVRTGDRGGVPGTDRLRAAGRAVRSVRAGPVERAVAAVRAALVRRRPVRPRHAEPHPLRHAHGAAGDRDGGRSCAAAGRCARAGGGLCRRTGGRADHAPGRRAAGVSLSAAGADHRGGARPQPDQFGDRDRHHLYAAICPADAWPGAVGAGGRLRRGGARDRGRARCG